MAAIWAAASRCVGVRRRARARALSSQYRSIDTLAHKKRDPNPRSCNELMCSAMCANRLALALQIKEAVQIPARNCGLRLVRVQTALAQQRLPHVTGWKM